MKQTSLFNLFQTAFRKGIRHPKYRWALIVGALFYLVSPLDIAPDVLPVVGWIDDGVLATFLISEVCQLMLENKKNRTSEETFATANTIDIEANPVV
ncbi:YkvA family protein [Acaryochloris sp. IP29b_bin.137]|uniref:YkvA family protein n=1 Tax=Acaryochloris sp. IP29b_bin.137 TaxID=2969217 RepID=UPI002610D2EA|nr:YkvA family protein [Acaryochloris sp. IP29b_bin.137]